MTTPTAPVGGDTSRAAPSSAKRLAWLQIAGLTFLAVLYFLRAGHPTLQNALGDDSAIYMVSARSLAGGHGYRLINRPDAPNAAFYPVGYPLLLSPLFAMLGTGANAMWAAKLLSGAFCLLFVWLTYRFLLHYLRPWAATLGALVVGLEPLTVMMAGEVMSECVFATLVMAGLLFFLKSEHKGEHLAERESGWVRAAFYAGIFLGAAMVVRTVGFTLVAAGILTLLWQGKRRETGAFLGGVAVCEVPWQLWTLSHKSNAFRGYGSELLSDYTWHTPLNNLWSLVSSSVPFGLFPALQTQAAEHILQKLHGGFLVSVLGLAVTAVLLIGGFQLLKQKSIVSVCIALYFGVIVFWPWEPSRFVMPLFPLLLAAFVRGAAFCWEAATGRRQKTAWGAVRAQTVAWGVVALCLCGALGVDAMRLQLVRRYDNWNGAHSKADWDEYQTAVTWIEHNLPHDAVVVSNFASTIYLLTGRNTVEVDSSGKHIADSIMQAQAWKRPVYFVGFRRLHPVTGVEFGLSPAEKLAQTKQANPRLRKVWASAEQNVGIFEVVSPPPGAGAPQGFNR